MYNDDVDYDDKSMPSFGSRVLNILFHFYIIYLSEKCTRRVHYALVMSVGIHIFKFEESLNQFPGTKKRVLRF